MRKHFISFLHAISKGDAAAGTRHMLAFGKHQTCPDPAAFQLDMTAMFRAECNIYSARGVDVDRVRFCPLSNAAACSGRGLACPPCGWM